MYQRQPRLAFLAFRLSLLRLSFSLQKLMSSGPRFGLMSDPLRLRHDLVLLQAGPSATVISPAPGL